MIRIFFLAILSFFIVTEIAAQQPKQCIRGTVSDNSSNSPIPFATVVILHSDPVLGVITDTAGNFRINNVPVGRYDIQVSFIGYEPSIIREVNVISAKETILNLSLKENSVTLKEVVVTPNVNKEQPLNALSTVSARMLSVDEAKRFAGGFDDPARMASSFAGVASGNGDNGIVIRGNNPKFFQWKMEGVEIPNPNHFADLASFGGGALTALSSQLLANSDFFTGAFPAEYGNALSGVFDILLRNGNNEKRENTFQAGIIGIDAASEGPLKKNGRSSYIFNYRYSTLGLIMPLLPKTTDGITYQDFAFKINVPTKKAGTFSFWGIGLLDHSGATEKTDSTKWVYNSDRENQDANQYMTAAGITHKYYFKKNIYLKTSLASTVSGIDFSIDNLNADLILKPKSNISNRNWNFVLSSFLNTKLSARHTNKTGIVATGLMYDILLENALHPNEPLSTLIDETGFSSLISAFTESSINLTDHLFMNIGLNSQVFTLNKHYTVEPRLGFKWQFAPMQSLGLAYGMHSRLERLNYYFTKDLSNNNELYNKNLDFSKAHHFVMSYDLSINEYAHFKIEAYYQHLYSIPVVDKTSFSFINLQADWFFNSKLQNSGSGRNYGLDLTMEKYLERGFYFMITASLFDSKYKGGDNIWRDTRFNKNYLLNFLTGKEWQTGKNRQNVFSANIRLGYQGGNRYIPVDESKTFASGRVVYDDTKAYTKQWPSAVLAHCTVSYKINKKKTTHEFAVKIMNATKQKDYYGFQYNYLKNSIDENSKVIFFPNISYKIEF